MDLVVSGFLAVFVLVGGCEREKPPPPETPDIPPLATQKPSQTSNPMSGRFDPHTSGENQLPPGHPAIDQAALDSNAEPVVLEEAPDGCTGIKRIVPQGWQAIEPPAPKKTGFSVAGPVAVFKLEKVKGDSEDAVAQLTHFPGMKNVPVQAQLDRWFDQVSQPDGSSTKDAAKVESWESGGIKVTVADMTGTMTPGGGTRRMIAAMIEHPNGPHFLKVTGPVETVEHWRDSVVSYLKSWEALE